MSEHASGKIRLQKFLAEAGVAARRAAEDLVLEGRVTINGRVVDGLPAFVDPGEDEVRVDGQRVRPAAKVYYLLNKPKGTVVSTFDPGGRKRVGDLMQDVKVRVFPVGRLEVDADGVLLMTNDGDLAEKLTHPRYGVVKVFRVEVKGQVDPEALVKVRKGMWLSEGRTAGARVNVTFSSREMTVMEITMRESKHRAIPRMLARLGHKVRKLTCIRLGRLTTKGMQAGEYRALTAEEVRHLQRLAERVSQGREETADKETRRQGDKEQRQRRETADAETRGRGDAGRQQHQRKTRRPGDKEQRRGRGPWMPGSGRGEGRGRRGQREE